MRRESDSIGMMEVPEKAYYGVQTLRAEDEFLYYGKAAASVVYPEYGEDKKGCGKDQLYGGRFGCGPGWERYVRPVMKLFRVSGRMNLLWIRFRAAQGPRQI